MSDAPPLQPSESAAATFGQPCVQVGFVGHRELTASGDFIKIRIAAELRRFGAGEQPKPGEPPLPKIIAHSSVASGADTLFAETVLAHGIEWHAYLPFPAAEFRKDFSAADWARAEAALAKAACIHEGPMPAGIDNAQPETRHAARVLAFSECGKRIADRSNVMIAVWDELPARGPGGAAETIDYAVNQRALRCFVINPAKPRSIRLRPSESSHPGND